MKGDKLVRWKMNHFYIRDGQALERQIGDHDIMAAGEVRSYVQSSMVEIIGEADQSNRKAVRIILPEDLETIDELGPDHNS